MLVMEKTRALRGVKEECVNNSSHKSWMLLHGRWSSEISCVKVARMIRQFKQQHYGARAAETRGRNQSEIDIIKRKEAQDFEGFLASRGRRQRTSIRKLRTWSLSVNSLVGFNKCDGHTIHSTWLIHRQCVNKLSWHAQMKTHQVPCDLKFKAGHK